MKNTTLKISIAALSLVMAPALAASETESRTTQVQYSDLDLTSQSGQDELDRRIDHAAAMVCDLDRSQVGTRIRSRDARRCFEDAKKQLDTHFAQVRREAQLGG